MIDEVLSELTDGVDKSLDELVIWRELAYAFARFFPEQISHQSKYAY